MEKAVVISVSFVLVLSGLYVGYIARRQRDNLSQFVVSMALIFIGLGTLLVGILLFTK